ncbi:hypothetical protein [Curtobacterium sp. 458]|uniref:hypothetical protein n=1 Tax=Curtobacterium sp. 458 TaxID=3050069 RepID=UPI0025B62697|nr:hypothetical protein [Curtobacterium sp. 458]WJY00844.1 hypothetical protein QPJ90_03885 [Curtobacterium sp. 458]
MTDRFFTITESHRTRFGTRSVADLRGDAVASTGPSSLWLAELAEQLDRANLTRLRDAPAGWGWTIAVPDGAEQPEPIWRKKHGNRPTRLLRVLREATGAAWTDAAAARIADLGEALERDGFTHLNSAPADWYWVPGGRS